MVGHQEAESRFQKLLTCLAHPPSYTCVRASTHLVPLEEIRLKLAEELKKVQFQDLLSVLMITHGQISQRDDEDDDDVVEAADVQLSRRDSCADSYSLANSRCAASSCQGTQV